MAGDRRPRHGAFHELTLGRRRTALCVVALHAILAAPSAAFAQSPPSAEAPAEDEDADAEGVEPGSGDESAPSQPSAAAPAGAPAAPARKSDEQADDQETDEDATAEEDAALLEEEGLSSEELKRAPPKGKGAIYGTVTDTKFNEPMIEAQVEIVGTKQPTSTDLEGHFRLELPPGTYRIRVGYELHRTARFEGVVVTAGELTELNVELVPDESAVDEILVETEVEKASAEGTALERKRSAVVSDGVGRSEIARTPDRNAAEAAQRVVGITIVGGRFVYVRGLGERYTNALLNGAPLPSTEPDRQTIPLDLFPALILEGIGITKQFTPDVPGDFAGGSVRIQSREFPKERLVQLSLNVGYNTETTFRGGNFQRQSGTDFLGFDDGTRKLPDDIPSERIDRNVPDDARTDAGRKINSYLSTERRGAPPNFGFSAVLGDSWKLGKEQKLGAVGAFNYSRTYQIFNVKLQRYTPDFLPDGTPVIRPSDNAIADETAEVTRWGGFGTVTYEPSRAHRIGLIAFHSQAGDNRGIELEGYREGADAIFHSTHLEYVSRALNFGQIKGTHEFQPLNRATLEWHVALSEASRNQPDTRDISYRKNPGTSTVGYLWSPSSQSGSHFYSEQGETSVGGGLDWTQPIFKHDELETRVKAGTLISMRDRNFTARRFTFEQSPRISPDIQELGLCEGTSYQRDCPDKLFVNDNIGPEGLQLTETTLSFDEYVGELNVYAGYGMIDSQILEEIRVLGGVRYEKTDMSFEGYDPHDPEGTRIKSGIDRSDWLPAFSLVYAVTPKSNTRFGLSRTIARPQLREIAPFLSPSYTLDLPVQGYEGLTVTNVTNADIRFEYFPTLKEVLALSFFYKHFVNPIEEVVVPGGNNGIATYRNAVSADLIGVELEGRKGLDFLSPALADFSLIGNLTLGRSLVDRGPQQTAVAERPLNYQSPYVVNLALDYDNQRSGTGVRVLYNVYGARLTQVGQQYIPDTYEQPRNLLDASIAQKFGKKFEVKLNMQNLLGEDVVFLHKDAQAYVPVTLADGTRVLNPGRKDPETKSYDVGTTFTLTGTFTY